MITLFYVIGSTVIQCVNGMCSNVNPQMFNAFVAIGAIELLCEIFGVKIWKKKG